MASDDSTDARPSAPDTAAPGTVPGPPGASAPGTDASAPAASADAAPVPSVTGLVVGTDVFSARVSRIVRQELDGVDVVSLRDIDDVWRWVEEDYSPASPIAFVTVTVGASGPTGDELLRPLAVTEPFCLTQFILLSTAEEVTGVGWLADQGRLDFLCYIPDFQDRPFTENLRDQLRRFYVAAGLVDNPEPHAGERFVFDVPLTDEQIMATIVDGIDSCLGRQPRIRVPSGVRLTQEGRSVEEVTLVLEGSVMLERKHALGQALLHHNSTGPIIGLLALTKRRKAFFTATTATDVRGVHLTFEQLNFVIQNRPDVAIFVAILFLRSLDRRLRHAEQIQIEHRELSHKLEEERENLATALHNLEEARTELMAQERLASLGSLAAGVAHELNNPLAAIHRISEHLAEDISALLDQAPQALWAQHTREALDEARKAAVLSTRQERELRRRMAEATGDKALAQRLVLFGIRNPELATTLTRSGSTLESAQTSASIGTQLRNLESASRRITELVSSLRSYARPDGDPVADVNIHDGLEDTVRLLSHRLRGITIERDYDDLPLVSCHPGKLAQVWTNIITNAADAMTEAHSGDGASIGTISITTTALDDEWIRVTIADDGPGISPDVLPHVFEPRFTTKGGRVRFGMGLGLSVSSSIVQHHGGTITLDSTPQGTVSVVDLPVAIPQEET